MDSELTLTVTLMLQLNSSVLKKVILVERGGVGKGVEGMGHC